MEKRMNNLDELNLSLPGAFEFAVRQMLRGKVYPTILLCPTEYEVQLYKKRKFFEFLKLTNTLLLEHKLKTSR